MIVATSGHIDHGKTLLVKTLTGVDTDRLPEEKKRGLSIDLGFAYTPCASGGTLGFVDVPGHERFVRTMIAGVTAIDCVMLVVAADDGPMPQTREHLAILDLLGVKKGVVALTKIDRVAPERIAQVRAEIVELLRTTRLAAAMIFPVSAVTGEGMASLRAWLDSAAQTGESLRQPGHFRMAIDRRFIIDGAGLVVTGAVSSGEVSVDDRLILSPGGVELRVRGIHAQNKKSQKGRAGERCAINIIAPRLSIEHVHRGDWLLAPDIHAPSLRFDARIRLLATEKRALRHWSCVHVHTGAADIAGHVAVLDKASIAPGTDALVQIVMHRPASLLYGDRIILRDQSAQRTLGGGYVIDPFAAALGRARPERLAVLDALDDVSALQAFSDAVFASPAGLHLKTFICARNLRDIDVQALPGQNSDIRIVGEGADRFVVSALRWAELTVQLRDMISTRHDTASGHGVSRAALETMMGRVVPSAVLDGVLHALVEQKIITYSGGHYKEAGAPAMLEGKDALLWSAIGPLLDTARPPSLAELAVAVKVVQRDVERMLQKAARLGLAIQIAPNRYYLPARLRELAVIADALARETKDGLVSIRAFRDRSGVGRNLCVEALEYFDRLGFTGRAGGHRRICKAIDDVKWVRHSG